MVQGHEGEHPPPPDFKPYNASAVASCADMERQLRGICPDHLMSVSKIQVGLPLSSALRCPGARCILLPTGDYRSLCIVSFDVPCAVNSSTNKYNCCPSLQTATVGAEAKSMMDVVPNWDSSEDNSKPRSQLLGDRGSYGYIISPGTFSTRNSSVLLLSSQMAAAAARAALQFGTRMMQPPEPPASLLMGPVLNIILEQIPMKPILLMSAVEALGKRADRCGRKNMANTSAVTMFYYNQVTGRWISMPDRSVFHAENSSISFMLDPEVAVRNGLSIFVSPLSGVPLEDGSSDQQYVLPSYRSAAAPRNSNTVTDCIVPVRMNSSEIRQIARQSMAIIGSPTHIVLEILPLITVEVLIDAMPQEADASSAGGNETNGSLLGTGPSLRRSTESAAAAAANAAAEESDLRLFTARKHARFKQHGRKSSIQKESRIKLHVIQKDSMRGMKGSGERRVMLDNSSTVFLNQNSSTQVYSVFFYNTSSGIWEPYWGCTYNSSLQEHACSIQPSFFEKNGLQVILALLAPAVNSTANANSIQQQNLPVIDKCAANAALLIGMCPSLVSYRWADPAMQGSTLLPCPAAKCILFHEQNLDRQHQCLALFNRACEVNSTTNVYDCCPSVQPVMSMGGLVHPFEVLPNWLAQEENSRVREQFIGLDRDIGYIIQPGTFSSPSSSSAALLVAPTAALFQQLGYANALGLGESHTREAFALLVGSLPPSRTITIERRITNMQALYQRPTVCGRIGMVNASTPTLLYFDFIKSRWTSSAEGNTFDHNTSRARLQLPQSAFYRISDSAYAALLIPVVGIPPGDEERHQYSLPMGFNMKQSCILPVNMSSEMHRLYHDTSDSPTWLYFENIPDHPVIVKVHTTNPIKIVVFHNTTSRKWQVLTGCTYDEQTMSYTCTLAPEFFNVNGLQPMLTVSNQKINYEILQGDGTPSLQYACNYLHSILAAPCKHSMGVKVFPYRMGTKMRCPGKRCNLLSVQPYLEDSNCIFAWNSTCEKVAGGKGSSECCDSARTVQLDKYTISWNEKEDNGQERLHTSAYKNNFNITLQPGTFADARSYVLIIDPLLFPNTFPAPNMYMEISTVKIVAIETAPLKPLKIDINLFDYPVLGKPIQHNRCMNLMSRLEYAPGIFYFDSVRSLWA
jgi:hypothetical protein